MLVCEVNAFAMRFDYGMILQILGSHMKVRVPLYILTDAKSIYDATAASKQLHEH